MLAHVIGKDIDTMRSALCAYTLIEFDSAEVSVRPEDYIAVQFTTKDMIERGGWEIVGRAPAPDFSKYLEDYEELKRRRFIGLTVRGSGVMRKFLDACVGDRAWNSFADPNYFDKLLLPDIPRPAGIVFTMSGDDISRD